MALNLGFLKTRVFQFDGMQITVGLLLAVLVIYLVWRSARKRS